MKTNISGFTILEVMIVLAVTAIIFFMSITFIQGKEAYNQFLVAINNVEAQLNEDINNVRDGSYILPNNISCTPGSNTSSLTSSSPSVISGSNSQGSSQGSNTGCIFVGDAIKLNSNKMENYIIVGNQFGVLLPGNLNPSPNYGIEDSNPTLVPSSVAPPLTQYFENGLTLVDACHYYPPSTNSLCKLAQIQDLGGIILGIVGSTAQQSQVNIVSDGNLNLNSPNFISETESFIAPPTNPNNNSYDGRHFASTTDNFELLCFKAGGINDSALFTVGGNNSSSVSYKIYYGSTSCQ